MKNSVLLGFVFWISIMAVNAQPERVIVFMIDGLHWEAPDRLNMPVFNSLKKEGVYVQQSYMITPHHPTVGDYGVMHTSSFPNPVLQAGTIFVSEENKFLQEMFSPKYSTAFLANTNAYQSVSRGFTTIIHDGQIKDEPLVDMSIELLKKQDIKYFRLHLQTAGNEGRYLSYTTPDKPYYRNIWGEGSPYVEAVERGDRLLGKLIDYLKEAGKWESTLLIVSSDQGQCNIGWHPIIAEDSWRTPLLFVGPGIAKDRTLPYFEHTDLTPTIADIMGVDTPNQDGGKGMVIDAVKSDVSADDFEHPEYIKTINEQINEFNRLRSKIILASDKDMYFSSLLTFLENELLTPEPFYHQDRFLEWHRAGTTKHLIEANELILKQMREELKNVKE